MDEPLSNLDAKLRVQTRVELKNLQRRLGTTTVYVTHDQAEAMTLADRVALMKNGVVQQVGPPTEVYAHPANKFVAGFLGSPAMNFMDGTMNPIDGGATFDASEFSFFVHPAVAKMFTGGPKKGTYGIRAEDVAVDTDQKEGSTAMEVFGSELMGSEQFVHCKKGKLDIVARAPMNFQATMGATVWLSFASPNAHFFDAETEQALV
jgi:multiple sugar transport system ATP-binding protein